LYGPAALEVFDISSTHPAQLYSFADESVAMASPTPVGAGEGGLRVDSVIFLNRIRSVGMSGTAPLQWSRGVDAAETGCADYVR
jgi:hypothetical protein